MDQRKLCERASTFKKQFCFYFFLKSFEDSKPLQQHIPQSIISHELLDTIDEVVVISKFVIIHILHM
jgi:hypothetical protein